MLKDLVSFGIGSAILAKEKVEEELNKLVEKGKISKDEAKKFVEDAKEKAKEEEEKLKSTVKEAIKDVLKELDVVTKEDLQKLKDECLKDK